MGLFEVKTIALRRNFHVARFAVVQDSRNFNVCPSEINRTETSRGAADFAKMFKYFQGNLMRSQPMKAL